MGDSFLHFRLDVIDNGIAAQLCIFRTNFGSDGESRRYGHSHQIHLSKICSFAAEKISHVGLTFGFAVTERINFFCHRALWVLFNIL